MIPVTVEIEKSGGNLFVSPHDVKQLSYINSVSLDGNQVQSDEAEIVIRQSPDTWKNAWDGVHRGCFARFYGVIDGVYRNEKYFYKSLVRTGKNEFVLTVQSPIGRLLSKHPGGLYNGQDLPDVILDVIGGVIPSEYDPALSSVKVYGWAPYQSRRKTLQDLMFAYGFIIRRDANQNLYFTVPTEDSYAMPRNAIYIGGSVDYRTGSGYARADITTKELFIDSSVEEKTIFDNVSSGLNADKLLVTFDSPMHSLSATDGLSIERDGDGNERSGVNFAVVSGVGKLKGKPFSVIESVVSVDGDADADPESVLSVSNAAFITPLNAAAVAERLLGVRRAVSVSVDLRRTKQRAGDLVTFTDQFGDGRSGYIASLRGNVTSIDKAAAEIICGYFPAWGNAYDTVIVLTPDNEAASNQWTVPPALDGKTLRVVLIGGGTGGASGQHGTDTDPYGNAFSGGKKGAPGGGGKIYEISLPDVKGGAVYEYHCGSGGAGGIRTDNKELDEKSETSYHYVSNAGSRGEATTLKGPSGEYSSDNGAYSGVGFYDTVNDTRYAAPGPDYGVDGGKATTAQENGDHSAPGYVNDEYYYVRLPDGRRWQSGQCGAGRAYWNTGEEQPDGWSYGGIGGGAAVGHHGDDGASVAMGAEGVGGMGGKGADAEAIFETGNLAYGSGGSGGHGGGEGGKGGSGSFSPGRRGDGGWGSNGQDGRPGCVLIYYKSPG